MGYYFKHIKKAVNFYIIITSTTISVQLKLNRFVLLILYFVILLLINCQPYSDNMRLALLLRKLSHFSYTYFRRCYRILLYQTHGYNITNYHPAWSIRTRNTYSDPLTQNGAVSIYFSDSDHVAKVLFRVVLLNHCGFLTEIQGTFFIIRCQYLHL